MTALLLKFALGGLNILKLIRTALQRFFGALNVQGWIGLVLSLLLTVLLVRAGGEARHWKKQSAQYEKLYNGELAHEAKIAKQAVDLKTKIDALTSIISSTLKERNDEENRRIAQSADALRLSGPGKAVCPGDSGSAAASVRQQQGPSTSANTGPAMSPENRAAVPWNWLVTVVQEHDELLSKVRAVEDQHKGLESAWQHKEVAK